LWTSCGERTKTEETQTTEQPAEVKPIVALGEYSSKFQRIVKTDEGIIRGINFGDALDEVIIKEDTIPLEDSTRYISFTVNLDEEEKEITDILYYFDKNRKISGFRLDIYLDNKRAVDSIAREFTTFFTDRYGNPSVQETKAIAWNGLDNTKVVMKDVGIKESPGLQIQIGRTN
jgi:hypothetical protein